MAGEVGLSSEDAVNGWRIEAHGPTTDAFAAMVAATGPAPLQRPLVERLIANGRLDAITSLLSRLTAEDRAQLATDALQIEGDRFRLAVDFFNQSLGSVTLADLTATPDLAALNVFLAEARKETEAQLAALKSGGDADKATEQKRSWQTDARITETIGNLGLLADHAAATALIQSLMEQGLMAADPRLNMLYLNTALTEPSP